MRTFFLINLLRAGSKELREDVQKGFVKVCMPTFSFSNAAVK